MTSIGKKRAAYLSLHQSTEQNANKRHKTTHGEPITMGTLQRAIDTNGTCVFAVGVCADVYDIVLNDVINGVIYKSACRKYDAYGRIIQLHELAYMQLPYSINNSETQMAPNLPNTHHLGYFARVIVNNNERLNVCFGETHSANQEEKTYYLQYCISNIWTAPIVVKLDTSSIDNFASAVYKLHNIYL